MLHSSGWFTRALSPLTFKDDLDVTVLALSRSLSLSLSLSLWRASTICILETWLQCLERNEKEKPTDRSVGINACADFGAGDWDYGLLFRQRQEYSKEFGIFLFMLVIGFGDDSRGKECFIKSTLATCCRPHLICIILRVMYHLTRTRMFSPAT